ncbi:MAG: alanine--tRNA ligase [Candidatus Cloacimonetes bacterium]|nr:alanine--tRNA ligase [Candidatus Cloacimonadota bacterium]
MHSSKDIRQEFISFFIQKGHSYIPSSPVIPIDDNTLLFANAGMNQFKSIFLGLKEPGVSRAVNSQKCIRAGGKHNDLEEVGKDGYHHTFFEMLGNWSFGDYYKLEAIKWAWELLTGTWKLPKDKLHATVHRSDQEAYSLWNNNTDIQPIHITYHGDKDNFWEMGESGPCGPCSEIHYDRGKDFCDKKSDPNHKCAVNGECGRYIEIWNLVFIQYYRDESGKLNPLRNKYVDTGAGLERICQILQGKSTNYETDLFFPILSKIAELSGQAYSEIGGLSHRVVADHIRTLVFALADGGFPSNEGRGYVLRRILRRAARHGRLLGFLEPFLWKLVDSVILIMGDHYTELNDKADFLKMIIKAEEERFNHTLDKGLEKFREIVAETTGDIISGANAFLLYDSFGFPLDLSMILAQEQDLIIDLEGFETEMEAQRQRARRASKFGFESQELEWVEFYTPEATEFVGYDEASCSARILRYSIQEGGRIKVQLDRTPFYAESGGQVADLGTMVNDSCQIKIENVIRMEDYIIHSGILVSGFPNAEPFNASIDVDRRNHIRRNHTATHLLHKALRIVLGDHVQQKGSLVEQAYFRFDFTHFQAVDHVQLKSIAQTVNEIVRENRRVFTRIESLQQAKSEGVTALFGEKYGDTVRIVEVEGYSKELCGGTHVSATGDIGLFVITSESSSAAGIRRIEGITGFYAELHLLSLQDKLSQFSHLLKCPEAQIMTKIESLNLQIEKLEEELNMLKNKELISILDSLVSKAFETGSTRLIKEVVNLNSGDFKALGELLKDNTTNTISVLFNQAEGRLTILCAVSPDLLQKHNAGKLVGKIAASLDGKGGGRADLAMAGAKDNSKLKETLLNLSDLIFAP